MLSKIFEVTNHKNKAKPGNVHYWPLHNLPKHINFAPKYSTKCLYK